MAAIFKSRRLVILLGALAVTLLFVVSTSLTGRGKEEPVVETRSVAPKKPPIGVKTPPATTGAAAPTHQASAGAVKKPLPVGMVPAAGEPAEESDLEQRRYTYRSNGRVDPFESPVSESATRGGAGGSDGGVIQLVGILEVGGERRALIEDSQGYGYVLSLGEKVGNGVVSKIGDESVVIRYTSYGVTETRTLTLARNDDNGGRIHERGH